MKSKLITALVTPFNKDDLVDVGELKILTKDIELQGSDGVVVGGTTGEGSNLTSDELIKVIKSIDEISNLEVIVNVGTNSTSKTIDLINKVKGYKHAAFMIIVPYYNKPTQKGIYEHFKKIAKTFKDEKFILYNVPSRTIVKLETDTLLQLINECDNIIGLKHASDDFELVKTVKEKHPKFLVYSGDDKYTLDMMKCGADGVISVLSHVFGKDIKELIDDYNNGIENEVIDKYIKELSEIFFCETNPIPIKYILSKKGYRSMNLRLPLTELSKDKHEKIDIILNL
jgi:4-hydroxy-tetrahydrodipicolinate synthase